MKVPNPSRMLLVVLLVLTVLVTLVGPDAVAEDRREVVRMSRLLLGEARQAYAQGDTDMALAKLDSVMLADPVNPDAHYFMGAIRLDMADTAGAEDILTDGVAVAPLSRRLKLLLARVKIELGEVDEAEGLVNEVTAIRSGDLDAVYLQGLIALARGDSTTAVTLWDEVLVETEKEGGL